MNQQMNQQMNRQMNRPKVINQFNDLIDSILVAYQNDSSPKFNADNDETRLPAVQPIKVDDDNLQRLFDGEIARIRELTERIRQQSSVFSRFDQFLVNVRTYGQYYDLVLLPDLLSILKQATCDAILGDGIRLKENDDETEFERQATEWRKQLKQLNQETGECMDLVRLLKSRYLICFMKAQKVIKGILNLKKDNEVSGSNSVNINSVGIKSNKSDQLDGMACLFLKLLVDQTDAAICKLAEDVKKFDDLFTDALAKFSRLIEEALELSKKIHSVLIEKMNLDDPPNHDRLNLDLPNFEACGERQCSDFKDNDSVRYKRLVSKLPNDVAFLRSLKI